MFQANSGVWILFCRKVEGRASGELKILDDCIGTDGVEDVSEGLGSDRGDGKVDRGRKEGEKKGGRRRMMAAREI